MSVFSSLGHTTSTRSFPSLATWKTNSSSSFGTNAARSYRRHSRQTLSMLALPRSRPPSWSRARYREPSRRNLSRATRLARHRRSVTVASAFLTSFPTRTTWRKLPVGHPIARHASSPHFTVVSPRHYLFVSNLPPLVGPLSDCENKNRLCRLWYQRPYRGECA